MARRPRVRERLPEVGRYTTSYFRLDMAELQRLERRSPEFAEATAENMAEELIQYIKDSWSPVSPSSPFDPPAKVTGELERNLRYGTRGPGGRFASGENAVAFSVYNDIEYAAALEFGHMRNSGKWVEPRPYFQPAIEWLRATYPSAIRSSWSRWLREEYGGDF